MFCCYLAFAADFLWGLISASDLCISFHAVIVVDNTKTIASTNMGFGLEGEPKGTQSMSVYIPTSHANPRKILGNILVK